MSPHRCRPGPAVVLGRAQQTSAGRKDRGLQEIVQDWVDAERKAGRPDSYLATQWASVRSYLRFNEAAPQWAPKFKIRRGTTLGNETVPTRQELARILSVLSPRDRVIALMMAHSGLRPGVLGNRYETAGLRLRDLPDLDIRRLEFGKLPFLVVVPADLSKSGSEYVTFGSTEAASAITGYLAQRRRRGERLEPDSALARSEPKTSIAHRRDFLSEKSIGTQLRKAMQKVVPKGKRWRAYVLRAYFSSQMESCERAGKTTRTLREALMGHMTSVEFAYHLGKKLHPEKIEEMRASYRRAEAFLSSTTARAEPTEELDPETRHTVLLVVGYTDEQISKMNVASMDKAGLLEAVKKSPARSGTAQRQRVIEESELERYLADGWVAKLHINGSKLVVERGG